MIQDTQRAKVLDMYSAGSTVNEIANAINTTPDGVYRHLLLLRKQGKLTANDDLMKQWHIVKGYNDRCYTRAQVCIAMGITRDRLKQVVSHGKRFGYTMGQFEPDNVPHYRRIGRLMRKKGGKMGCLGDVLNELPDEVQDWLVEQATDTIATLVGGFIKDAYYEEVELPQQGTERKTA